MKICDVYLNDFRLDFEKRTKRIDLSIIDNGNFLKKYHELLIKAIGLIREAKTKETINHDESFRLYEEAFNIYSELEEFISDNSKKINWARYKYGKLNYRNITITLSIGLLSGVILDLFDLIPYDKIWSWIKSIFS